MAESNKQGQIPVLVVAGPTATGKTALAVELCKQLNGEVISADSMQIYRGLDIGTAKPQPEERGGVPHHLFDILNPNESYSVAQYHRDALRVAKQIVARGKTPIFCGGTGLYISSLIHGIQFSDGTRDASIRLWLNEQYAQNPQALYIRLQAQDPEYAAMIHVNDQKRLVRALEMIEAGKVTPSEHAALSRRNPGVLRPMLAVLYCVQREELYARINRRIDTMLRRGLLEEARYVYNNRDSFLTAAQAIGYKEFFAYFENADSLENCMEALKMATRRYAKRQLTWFRREEAALWYEIDKNTPEQILNSVKKEWKLF